MNDDELEALYRKLQQLESKISLEIDEIDEIKSSIHEVRILTRKCLFTRIFELHVLPKALHLAPDVDVSLNDDILFLLIDCYFKDIARTRNFHGYPYANLPKKAAFTAEWILKRKPITYDDSPPMPEHVRETFALLNEYFALLCAFEVATLDINLLDGEQQNDLLYYFTYNNVDAGALVLWFTLYFDSKGIPKHGEEEE